VVTPVTCWAGQDSAASMIFSPPSLTPSSAPCPSSRDDLRELWSRDGVLARGLFVSREAQTRLKGALRRAGHISLSLLYLPCFAAVLAAERPSPFLVRASDAM
jgi:hypothetical protein